MEWRTLHELSVDLDISVRVLRHRLRQLLSAGTLVEGRDCRRDDYVDETHFVWRVDPTVFMRATRLFPVTTSDNHENTVDTNLGSRPAVAAAQPGTQREQTSINVDTTRPPMEREIIDLLKGQLSAKDGQIADLSEQNKKLNDVNLKLVAQTVQQSDRIQTLLRLTEGKMDLADTVTEAGSGTATTDSNPADHVADTGSNFGNKPPSSSRDWRHDLAA